MNSIEQDEAIEHLREEVLELAADNGKLQRRIDDLANEVQAMQPTKRTKDHFGVSQ